MSSRSYRCGLARRAELPGITLAHGEETRVRVAVERRRKGAMEQWYELRAEVVSPRHPLVVAATAMLVGSVEPTAGERALEPAEQRFVSLMHTQGYMRLAPVPAEMAFADEQSNQHSLFEVAWHPVRSLPLLALAAARRRTARVRVWLCFTVRLHVNGVCI
jgi:hypothetical protein